MVCDASEKNGHGRIRRPQDYVFGARYFARAITAKRLPNKSTVCVNFDDAYHLAKDTLTANRDKFEVIALAEFETLDGCKSKRSSSTAA
jgi:hypothetical protein